MAKVSKTKMFQLLRLLDQGALQEGVIRQAWSCWEALDDASKKEMMVGGSGSADRRRARLWSAAWDGGMDSRFRGNDGGRNE